MRRWLPPSLPLVQLLLPRQRVERLANKLRLVCQPLPNLQA